MSFTNFPAHHTSTNNQQQHHQQVYETTTVQTPQGPKRVVKPTSSWQVRWLKPFDWIKWKVYEFHEDLQLLTENQTLNDSISIALCLFLNFMMLLVTTGAIRKVYGFLLLLASILNAGMFIYSTKNYQLFHFKMQQKGKGNVSQRPFRVAAEDNLDSNVPSLITEMKMWQPSKLQTDVFCFFSPLQVSILLLLDTDTTFGVQLLYYVIAAATALALYGLVAMFKGREEDKSILFNEVYAEYTRYVNSITCKTIADEGIQTDVSDVSSASLRTNYPDLNESYHRDFMNTISEVTTPRKSGSRLMLVSSSVKEETTDTNDVPSHFVSPVYSSSPSLSDKPSRRRNPFQQS